MKNILLIGDSILVGSNQTSGYGTIVRDMLKDKANVYIPLDNARYTMYTLRNLAGWIDANAPRKDGHCSVEQSGVGYRRILSGRSTDSLTFLCRYSAANLSKNQIILSEC